MFEQSSDNKKVKDLNIMYKAIVLVNFVIIGFDYKTSNIKVIFTKQVIGRKIFSINLPPKMVLNKK